MYDKGLSNEQVNVLKRFLDDPLVKCIRLEGPIGERGSFYIDYEDDKGYPRVLVIAQDGSI